MADIATLKALQSRIRQSKGGDRELAVEIACALLGGEPYLCEIALLGDRWKRKVGNAYFDVADITTYPDGLGACVALLNAVLPGWKWNRDWDGNISLDDDRQGGIGNDDVYTLRCANDCLTFIDAIISAFVAKLEAAKRENVG